MLIAILLFAAAVTALAYFIVCFADKMDNAELAVYILLMAWGAMFAGLLIERYARPAALLYSLALSP